MVPRSNQGSAMYHVYRFDAETHRHVFYFRDGSTYCDRDLAEIWLDLREAEAKAEEVGARVFPAFDDLEPCDAMGELESRSHG